MTLNLNASIKNAMLVFAKARKRRDFFVAVISCCRGGRGFAAGRGTSRR
jgi:hypothetical protein